MTENGNDKAPYWTDEQLKRRRQRSLAIAWALGALVALFFIITIAKLGGNVAKRPVFGAVDVIERIG